MVQSLTEKEFLAKIANYKHHSDEWKYLGDKPTIIDFYAEWCGPCKMIAPVLESLSKIYGNRVNFYKVNTEQELTLSNIFEIKSIPTLLFIPVEGRPQIAQGAIPKVQLVEIINKILLK